MSLQDIPNKIRSKDCIIEIHGLGYVGFPLLVRLAISGFRTIGIDKDAKKISRIQEGNLIESELFLKHEFLESLNSGIISLTQKTTKSDLPKISIVCVPTPIPTATVNSDVFIKEAVESIFDNAKKGDVIILESSIEVGTTDKIKSLIELKGFEVGRDIGLAFCPERIDPQNKKWNLQNIPRIIYCSDNTTYEICKEVYHHINNSNLKRVESAKIAEVVKSFENAFRLVNISLVNELAILCDKLKISVKEVLEAAATKPFGFMPFYPSAGAGGHCIPKDPKFLLESAKNYGIEFKTLEAALWINSYIPQYIVNSIENTLDKLKLEKSVIICGLSYKPDIEDMRDSPGFKILKEMKDRDFKVVTFDPYFKHEIKEKYLVENALRGENFQSINSLGDDSIQNFSCLCIVQHHTKIQFRLNEIYKKSIIPVIFDCCGKLRKNPNYKTILKSFGN